MTIVQAIAEATRCYNMIQPDLEEGETKKDWIQTYAEALMEGDRLMINKTLEVTGYVNDGTDTRFIKIGEKVELVGMTVYHGSRVYGSLDNFKRRYKFKEVAISK